MNNMNEERWITGTVETISHACCGGVTYRILSLLFDQEPPDDTEPAEWISSTKAAKLLGWGASTLRKYRWQGKGPKGYVSTSPATGVYLLSEVTKFMSERTRKKTK